MSDSEINLMIGDCINRQSKMTEWEIDFIDSIMEEAYLSARQKQVLDNIWDRVTA